MHNTPAIPAPSAAPRALSPAVEGGTPATQSLGAFLRSRRARLQPEDVGLVAHGTRRRVPGLRREELAMLAGVSVAYYTTLEQGQSRNASEGVLDALARALRLDEVERAHLHDLARPPRTVKRPAARTEAAHPRMRQLLDAVDAVPGLVLGRRLEILAWNHTGHALMASHLPYEAPADPARRPSFPRMLFLDAHTRELHVPRWEDEARANVAYLRLVAGRHPDDQDLAALIGELCIKSERFAELWQRRGVRECTHGIKEFHHPLVGRLSLSYDMLRLPDRPDQQLQLLSAEPGSPSEAALRLLNTQLTLSGR
ncbi:helix-turn-helix transcriptional regulator [Streptomyces sp. NPDC041068]|uniref:helix-turn-helix transcriptional regulator n=1 Tax=Streptomyces sp. NPDC041068 TaxID=3155130 RepID=UPI0033C62FD8